MSKFLSKVTQEIEKVSGHVRNELIGKFDYDRRHDDPDEIAADEKRQRINETHRFQSFATERTHNFVKWHIDGHDYFWAVSEMLENAKEVIFILDWWLTPEIYLRRPPADFPEYRLDKLLQRKAEQGVHVYVVVYKEVTQTMTMSSSHTKKALEALHPNIVVLRHPDHIGSKDDVEFWSHHEKVVVVDNHYACIGGLDLCFGRWDMHTHPLADVHPTNFSKTLFPGQDYNNARIKDFENVWQFASGTIDLLDTARMPWHDVHMTLTGPCVLDIVEHFVERWNEIRHRKYRSDPKVPVLALPHNVEFAPNEAVAEHPKRESWADMGRRYRQRWHAPPEDPVHREVGFKKPDPMSCKVQVCRSVSDWSQGLLTEHSIQNAYIELINEANHFIYIENQFFISATVEGGQVTNLVAQALVTRIIRAHQGGEKFKVIICIPELPAFAGAIKDQSSLKIIMAAQYRTINRGGTSIYEQLRKEGIEPTDYIRFFNLRSYDRINAPRSTYIAKAEELSGIKFPTAEVALAREWVREDPGAQTDVTIRVNRPTKPTDWIPTPENAADSSGKKAPEETITVPIPKSPEEAKETVKKFEDAARVIRGDEDVSDNVSQHALMDKTRLEDEKWLGTPEEELDCYVSELCYIHTKLMIVDDRRVIMGSANLNDRSQKGNGDSEIALVVEDNDLVKTTMDGKPYMAARFAATLRRKLFREHLGLIPAPEHLTHPSSFMRPAPIPNEDEFDQETDQLVADPLADSTQALWNDTAKKNREVFTELFRPVPTNLVREWKQLDNYAPQVKTGHVIPGVPLERVKQRLGEVRGTLVEMAIDFLIDETEFVNGPEWKGLNPTLPIYI